VVTGAASGLGLAIAAGLESCGATVVGVDIASGVDVRDAAAVSDVVDEVAARHGRLDAVFANAGIARGRGLLDDSVDDFDLGDWRALFEVNLMGVVHTMRAAARWMKRWRSGSIVATASTAGLRADPLVSYSYVVAKAGVVNLVRQAALDLARWNIRVNAIAPGPFRTNIGGGPVSPAGENLWSEQVPLRRMGDPAEIRGLAVLLASSASSFMTGGVYTIDGGAMLQSMAVE
jgi:NAD(P)-dependent dehydrogenase (short-subunit alcohol dehydrogenase family)